MGAGDPYKCRSHRTHRLRSCVPAKASGLSSGVGRSRVCPGRDRSNVCFLNTLPERVDGLLHQGACRGVIRVLARHRDLFFGEPAIISGADLPSLVGTSREMTGRVLRDLERDGTLARVGRTGLRLLLPDRLDAADASLAREEP
jgi:CRP-like cAMP-binding protein